MRTTVLACLLVGCCGSDRPTSFRGLMEHHKRERQQWTVGDPVTPTVADDATDQVPDGCTCMGRSVAIKMVAPPLFECTIVTPWEHGMFQQGPIWFVAGRWYLPVRVDEGWMGRRIENGDVVSGVVSRREIMVNGHDSPLPSGEKHEFTLRPESESVNQCLDQIHEWMRDCPFHGNAYTER